MAGSGQWQEGAIDVSISAGMDLSSERLAVDASMTLLSENTVFDLRGAARMRPGAERGSDVPGAALGAFALRDTPVVLAPTALRYTDGEWASPNEDTRDRHWSYGFAGYTATAGGVGEILLSSAQQTLTHRFVGWASVSGVLSVDVALLDGVAIGSIKVTENRIYGLELFEQGMASTVRVVWVEQSGINYLVRTCLVKATDTGLEMTAVWDLARPATLSAASVSIAAVPRRSGYGFFVAYKAGGFDYPMVFEYSGAATGSVVLLYEYSGAGNPQQPLGYLDLALTVVDGAEHLALAYCKAVEHVVVVVFRLPPSGDPFASVWITNVFHAIERLAAHVAPCREGFVVMSTRLNAPYTSEWMMIAVQPPGINPVAYHYPETLSGYEPMQRPGGLRGQGIFPMVRVALDYQTAGNPRRIYGRGGHLFSLHRDAEGELAIASVGRVGIDAVDDISAVLRATKMRSRQDLPTHSDVVAGAYVSNGYGWDQIARGYTLDAHRERVVRHTQHTAEANGVVYVPGAQPLVFDGRNCVEATWLEPPVIRTITEIPDEGNVTGRSIIAVAYWLDSQGRMHRSMPSVARTWSGFEAGAVTVFLPQLFQNFPQVVDELDPHAPWLEFYVREIDASADHVGGGYRAPTSIDPLNGVATYGVANLDNVVLYTNFGNELESAPLPPVVAFELIGDRMWALEAEDRTRLWPSKVLTDGYAFEWAAELVREVPGEDTLMISQINGWPVAFRPDGLFVIYGDGPGNDGAGGEWTPARKVTGAPGCYAADSVVPVPQGVVYQSDSGFHLLQPDLTVADISFGELGTDRTEVWAATYSDRDRRAVIWCSPDQPVVVWDVRSSAWSVWAPPLETLGAVQLASGGVFTVAADGNADAPLVYETDHYADGDEVGLRVTWRSAWLQPSMLSGRCEWGPIFVTMRRLSPHALTVRVYADGDDSVSSEHVFSPSDVSGEDSGGVYLMQANNLFGDPRFRKARALSIELVVDRDAGLGGSAGAGMAGYPLACRVHVRSDQDTKRRQIAAGGRA